MRLISVIASVVLVIGCSAPQPQHTRHMHSEFTLAQGSLILLNPLLASQPIFRGEPTQQKIADPYEMTYVTTSGAEGAIAGLITHIALEGGRQKHARQQQLENDNQVLIPIQAELALLDINHQLEGIVDQLPATQALSQDAVEASYTLTMQPVFFVAQDYSVLRLKNIFALHNSASSTQDNALYQNLIDTSYPLSQDITSDEFALSLEQAVNQLLDASIQLVLADVRGEIPESDHMATFKIGSASHPRYERAQLLAESCDGITLRNLRNWLVQVPHSMHHNSSLSCQGTSGL